MNTIKTKGFTLIELLIVIAIIAILATAVILLLNPAALLAQARDSQRISDLGTLRTAIALYQSTSGGSLGAGNCTVFTGGDATAGCGGRHAAVAVPAVNSRAVNGLGWIPVNFDGTPGGSPISVLPIDPRTGVLACGFGFSPLKKCYYSYVGNAAGTFEINADMESQRYSCGGTDDAEGSDGGNLPFGLPLVCATTSVREVGNDPNLDL